MSARVRDRIGQAWARLVDRRWAVPAYQAGWDDALMFAGFSEAKRAELRRQHFGK